MMSNVGQTCEFVFNQVYIYYYTHKKIFVKRLKALFKIFFVSCPKNVEWKKNKKQLKYQKPTRFFLDF